MFAEGLLTPEQSEMLVAESTLLATSPNNLLDFIEILNKSFMIEFDPNDGINSLGFYGIDVGDLSGRLTLTLENGATEIVSLVVPHTVGAPIQSYFYFGVITRGKIITKAVYDNDGSAASAGFDAFLFDDVTVGVAKALPIPEGGSTVAFLGLALIGLAGFRYKYAALKRFVQK